MDLGKAQFNALDLLHIAAANDIWIPRRLNDVFPIMNFLDRLLGDKREIRFEDVVWRRTPHFPVSLYSCFQRERRSTATVELQLPILSEEPRRPSA
jgi:hypothetical protein